MDCEVNGEVSEMLTLNENLHKPYVENSNNLANESLSSFKNENSKSEAVSHSSSNAESLATKSNSSLGSNQLSSDLLSKSLQDSTNLDLINKNCVNNKIPISLSQNSGKNLGTPVEIETNTKSDGEVLPLNCNANEKEEQINTKESECSVKNSPHETEFPVSSLEEINIKKNENNSIEKEKTNDNISQDSVSAAEKSIKSSDIKFPDIFNKEPTVGEKEPLQFTSISALVGHSDIAKSCVISNKSVPNFTENILPSEQMKFPPTTNMTSERGNYAEHFHTPKLKDSNADFMCGGSFREINPLEKLNEHLNSIGYLNKQNVSINQAEKTDFSAGLKLDTLKNCNKENKNMNVSCPHPRPQNESSESLIFTELSNDETGFPEVFTGLVTIGKYISVKGDFTLRSSEALVESPSVIAPYLLKEPDSFPPRDSKLEQKDFFHSTAGELLIGIGVSRVNEWFHRDMARIKKRQIKKEGKLPQLEEELNLHKNFYLEAKKANSVYTFSYNSCENCGFTTESAVVMEGHRLVPHVTPRREYQCNYCNTINRDPKAMLDHMEKIHGKTGRIQPPVLFFECPYCTTFESNSKTKLNIHLAKCQRFFDHTTNQAPPRDFEFPALTPKPITVAVVKAYEKSLSSMQRGRGRPKKVDSFPDSLMMNQFTPSPSSVVPNHISSYRPSSSSPLSESLNMQNQIMSPMQLSNMAIRSPHTSSISPLQPPIHLPPPTNRLFPVNSVTPIVPMLGNSHLVTSPSQFSFSPNLVNTGSKKIPAPNTPFFNSVFGAGIRQQSTPKSMPEVTITPLPKLQGPYPVPLKSTTASSTSSMQSNSLVVCEICDGYIKDLEQLRTHMQLIHKVKIHPKMLVSRPPLNCQKCQWRFFTDQGLERHLLGAHGLVTSNMQELANKGKDAGCCTICGRVYASKLVGHMNQVHKITLKPAHLSYKCTVCSATFNLYRLFENHVYLVHSGAAKRAAADASSAAKKLKSDCLQEGESANHKAKRTSGGVDEENIKKCKECGSDISHSNSEKCEKCLKSGDLVQGTFNNTVRDELRKNEHCEEAAC